jgi:hypothetical protein
MHHARRLIGKEERHFTGLRKTTPGTPLQIVSILLANPGVYCAFRVNGGLERSWQNMP